MFTQPNQTTESTPHHVFQLRSTIFEKDQIKQINTFCFVGTLPSFLPVAVDVLYSLNILIDYINRLRVRGLTQLILSVHKRPIFCRILNVCLILKNFYQQLNQFFKHYEPHLIFHSYCN